MMMDTEVQENDKGDRLENCAVIKKWPPVDRADIVNNLREIGCLE
jgi:hypothetical protein